MSIATDRALAAHHVTGDASGDWLTTRQASALVGVSVATLRRWCDAGEIHAFTTPGGHRRFSRAAVLGLATGSGHRQDVGCNGETQVRIVRAYRRELRRRPETGPTLDGMGDRRRQLLRDRGMRVVASLVDYLDARPRDAWRHAADAHEAAAACGSAAAAEGISLDDTIALFIRFRAPFVHELGALVRAQGRTAADATAVLEAASDALDALLPAVVGGYKEGRRPTAS